MPCTHEDPDWPNFTWDSEALSPILGALRYREGQLIGWMQSFGFGLRQEANLKTLADDVVKSSAIEGESLDLDEVRSSIARRLGLDVGGHGFWPARRRHVMRLSSKRGANRRRR